VEITSSGSAEKEEIGNTQKNGDQSDSRNSSSTEEEKTRKMKKKARPKSKKARTASRAKVSEAYIQQLRAERGRPPMTGEYVGLAEANDERVRKLRLEREAQALNMADTLQILRKANLDSETTAEEASLIPMADIASRIREAQAEIVRVAKSSSNIKGDLQRVLKVSASLTMGLVDVLRTRADQTGERIGSEETRRLREQVERLGRAQDAMEARINAMKDEMEAAKAKANEGKIKVES